MHEYKRKNVKSASPKESRVLCVVLTLAISRVRFCMDDKNNTKHISCSHCDIPHLNSCALIPGNYSEDLSITASPVPSLLSS